MRHPPFATTFTNGFAIETCNLYPLLILLILFTRIPLHYLMNKQTECMNASQINKMLVYIDNIFTNVLDLNITPGIFF